jgi:hypothetical protein
MLHAGIVAHVLVDREMTRKMKIQRRLAIKIVTAPEVEGKILGTRRKFPGEPFEDGPSKQWIGLLKEKAAFKQRSLQPILGLPDGHDAPR